MAAVMELSYKKLPAIDLPTFEEGSTKHTELKPSNSSMALLMSILISFLLLGGNDQQQNTTENSAGDECGET